MTDPSQTIKNLFQNKYILYAGLAVGALVVLKIVMGFGGGKGGGGRADMAQGGAASADNAEAAIKAAEAVLAQAVEGVA